MTAISRRAVLMGLGAAAAASATGVAAMLPEAAPAQAAGRLVVSGVDQYGNAVREVYRWFRTAGTDEALFDSTHRIYHEWVLRDPDDDSALAYMLMEDEREPAPASREMVERFRRYANEVFELGGEA